MVELVRDWAEGAEDHLEWDDITRVPREVKSI